MKNDAHYFAILHEEMNTKFDVLTEAIADIRRILVTEVATKEELAEVKADVKAIKAALSDTSRQVSDHERRIIILEAKTSIA